MKWSGLDYLWCGHSYRLTICNITIMHLFAPNNWAVQRFYFESQPVRLQPDRRCLTQLSSACVLRHPYTDFGFPRWNSSLFSSQDQCHPNPTWQRRKLVLPWSGLNRLALLFYSAAHLNKGGGWGGFCSNTGLEPMQLPLSPRVF